jgi:hypothetical protein
MSYTNLLFKGLIMTQPKHAAELEALIRKAMEDGVVTSAEYETIIFKADEDGVITPTERALLSKFQDMLDDKTVRRVP